MAQDYKVNPDGEGLGWYSNERFVIGHVDEVNGPGSQEVPAFAPTRRELFELAKYWATIELRLDFSWFVTQQTGSSEIRLGPFARRRLARIAEVLGEEEAGKAVQEAHTEFAKNIDLKAWNIFLNGTAEQRRALQDEIAREMSGADSEEVARISELMRGLALDYPVAEVGKSVRFAILPAFTAAAVADPHCVIVPILHYLNANANGHYRKEVDGSFPPIHWEVRHLGLSPMDIKQIQKLADPGEAASNFDIVMTRTDPACGHEFRRAANKARWQLNPDLATEVEKAAGEISNALATKLAGRAGVTIFDNFQLASIPTPGAS